MNIEEIIGIMWGFRFGYKLGFDSALENDGYKKDIILISKGFNQDIAKDKAYPSICL